MSGWLLLTLLAVIACFSFVLLYGAPYVPTLSRQTEVALDLLNLKKGQTMLELGCGDGKVLLAAAARGYVVVGYELNPILALIAWLRTRRYGHQVRVVCGNFWNQAWPPADGIFVFLLDKFMVRLDTAIKKQPHRPVRLVSFAFQIPGTKPKAAKEGIYLYEYQA
ncbi:MAG TPA: class I SAM-dependent methyltransferase [Hymenobacter sp.]|jgi:SAM-dependent methyltransferase